MSNIPTYNWTGKSGKRYTYYVYPVGSKFAEKPGNYGFCKKNAAGNWVPRYFGQSGNLRDRLGKHEKEVCAIANGATHVHAHLNAHETDHLAEERDLIRRFNPACNEQLVA